MTLTDQDIRALTFLACRSRPTGARQWTEADVAAEVTKLRTRDRGAVCCAVIRAAMDRGAERPAVISSAGSHWGDTVVPGAFVPSSAPPGTRCTICDGVADRHTLRDHEFRRPQPKAAPEVIHGAIAALKAEVAVAERDPAPTGLETAGKPELAARLEALIEHNPGVRAAPMQSEEEEAG